MNVTLSDQQLTAKIDAFMRRKVSEFPELIERDQPTFSPFHIFSRFHK